MDVDVDVDLVATEQVGLGERADVRRGSTPSPSSSPTGGSTSTLELAAVTSRASSRTSVASADGMAMTTPVASSLGDAARSDGSGAEHGHAARCGGAACAGRRRGGRPAGRGCGGCAASRVMQLLAALAGAEDQHPLHALALGQLEALPAPAARRSGPCT